jgi:predicted dehydrogenase
MTLRQFPTALSAPSTINSQLSASSVLRVAIVGCGKIADQHVQAIHRISDSTIVAVCDRELLMARQLGERFGIGDCFCELEDMLRTVKPDVVHITTPPQGHLALARKCLEFGSHVYLEKPFTVTAPEAESVINLAQARGLKVTAGHNYQFTLEMMRMRDLVGEGFLKGSPLHMESYWSYDLGDTSYVAPVVGNREHWVRQLPGQLLHNLISHGVARLAEFLDDDVTEICATADQSPRMRALGGGEVLDELRVLLRDCKGTTALFSFSTQIKGVNQFRVYGPENSMIADIITGSLVRNRSRSYQSYLTYFVPSFRSGIEYLRNAFRNVNDFLAKRLYQDFGMKELIERFHISIRHGGAVPIPYREIILTARIMDEVFRQVYPAQTESTSVGESLSVTAQSSAA